MVKDCTHTEIVTIGGDTTCREVTTKTTECITTTHLALCDVCHRGATPTAEVPGEVAPSVGISAPGPPSASPTVFKGEASKGHSSLLVSAVAWFVGFICAVFVI